MGQALGREMTQVWSPSKWFRQFKSPLGIALLVSLLLHLYVWLMAVLVQAALQNGWLPRWLEKAVQPVAANILPVLKTNGTNTPVKPPESWQEIPLQFVEIDPATTSEDAPEQTPYFSTANTRAANPNPTPSQQSRPRVDGTRQNALKTFDTPRPAEKAVPQQAKASPTAPEEAQQRKAQEAREAQTKVEAPSVAPGETLQAKATPQTTQLEKPSNQPPQPAQEAQQAQTEQTATPKRRSPKRLSEVMPIRGSVVGEKMKQEGGVNRMAVESSLDVKSSPLGDYHYRMVIAVQQQWYRLLEERRYALERIGKVVISFDLHSDGTVSGLTTKNSDVGEVLSFLCELSVLQPAPFGRWPPEIRRTIGGDVIPVTFTFNYY